MAGTPQPYQQLDLSGAVQTATSRFLRKRNEVVSSKNAVFNKKIGSAARRDGYEQVARTIQAGNDGLGLHVYKYSGNNKVVVGINNSTNTNAGLRYMDTANYWTDIITNAAANTRFQMLDYLDEMFVVGVAPDTNTYLTTQTVDNTLTSSTSRDVYAAPKARFVDFFGGRLHLMNVEVGGKPYRDRVYVSNAIAPLGSSTAALTFVQNDQQGLLQQLKVDSARYTKVGMSIDIYSANTNSKVVSAITIISVDKKNNIISFAPTSITVKDNDELWLTGRKGEPGVYWNTDYPSVETADFLKIPAGTDANPEITAHGQNNNRKLYFTRNSTWKFDNANLVNVSDTIGCVAAETVRNVGSWTLWLHTTGVWGYNDSTGQLRLLSKAVDDYIKGINQSTVNKASAVVVGRVYKLAVGEIADIGASTTSTSTSSTSTSSTSSSTSSTSTSSTSTSSTSTSQTFTTTSTSSTSTSSTSISTSSTSQSTSTSSTSQSTSTSSTTTTTSPSTKNVLRLVYDFDSNSWWPEFHKREFRYQVMHTMNGYTKPYFLDETGRLWRDETGNLDGVDTIPFEVELGRVDNGTPLKKSYTGCVVQSEKAKAAMVLVSVDNGNWKNIGQVTEDNQAFKLPAWAVGRDINYKLIYNNQGDGPIFDGITSFFSVDEVKIG